MSRLLDPKRDGKYPFDYTPSAQTDLAKTFARVRKEQREAQPTAQPKVTAITPIAKVRK